MASLETKFSQIGWIDPDDIKTWRDRIFLTFDVEWAQDAILADTIDLVERGGVAATWFVTHDTPLLNRMRANQQFELGIHPNFNNLFEGNASNGRTAAEVIDRLLEIVPEAKSVRSHSMTQNSRLLDLFLERGLTHDCNHFIPEQTRIELKPWRLWNGIIKVPYFWEDDLVFNCLNSSTVSDLLGRNGVKVFDFHPIHIFLNTENIDRYEITRPWHDHPSELINHRSSSLDGTRELLKNLLLTGL